MDKEFHASPPPFPERNGVPPPFSRPPGKGTWFLQSCLVAGCTTVVVPFALIFGFFGFLYFLAAGSVKSGVGALDSIYAAGAGSNLRERIIRAGAEGAGAIAVVTIHGGIDGDGSPLEGDGALARVSEELRSAVENDRVRAILLQIDSPGGGLTASDQIHREVLKAREAGKTVIAWAGDTMASGGYYIAVASEGIMASPTCTVGSIGVIIQHFQIESLMEKLGVKVDPIASGDHKTLGTPFREMTPAERKILQDFIGASHRRFVDVVAAGRGMPVEEVEKLATGDIFIPRQALDSGLVDRIGYIEDAVAWIEEIAGESDMRLIGYRRQMSLSDLFREAGRGVTGALVEASVSRSAPRSMAAWGGRE